jgi:hypothetical protein
VYSEGKALRQARQLVMVPRRVYLLAAGQIVEIPELHTFRCLPQVFWQYAFLDEHAAEIGVARKRMDRDSGEEPVPSPDAEFLNPEGGRFRRGKGAEWDEDCQATFFPGSSRLLVSRPHRLPCAGPHRPIRRGTPFAERIRNIRDQPQSQLKAADLQRGLLAAGQKE